MKFEIFKNIFNNEIIFLTKAYLLESIIFYKNTNFIYKNCLNIKNFLIENMINIQNKNFSNAYKVLFEKYFEELCYKNLNKTISNKDKNKKQEYLDLDQLFTDGKYIYFIEQKVRDDHDSTKKRGQVENFEKKIIALLEIYKETEIKSFTYFVDPSLVKNKNFYIEEVKKIEKDYNIYSRLCYGEEFWLEIGHKEIWDEMLKYLELWKKEIPDMPSINFDDNAMESFEEIKNISLSIFRKLFENKEICKEILPILFPENKVLRMLVEYFETQDKSIYKNLAEMIKNYIKK